MAEVLRNIQRAIVNVMPSSVYNIVSLTKHYLVRGYARTIYSQDGIDIFLLGKLKHVKKPFYLDVGANHPFSISNTYLLHKRGGRGINIDAMPGQMKLFNITRPKDTNIEAAISDKAGKQKLYVFHASALSTLEPGVLSRRDNKDKIKKEVIVQTKTLTSILNKHLPKNQEIHFMNLDVEGFELKVLKSNNWKKYSPWYISVEFFCSELNDIMKCPCAKFLAKQGYSPVYYSGKNIVFEHKSVKKKRTK